MVVKVLEITRRSSSCMKTKIVYVQCAVNFVQSE